MNTSKAILTACALTGMLGTSSLIPSQTFAAEEQVEQDRVTQRGWKEIDGKKYYFDEDGSTHKWTLQENDKQYYFNEDGTMHTGWLQWNSDRTWSYFNKDGVMAKGLTKIDGKTYYFDEDGIKYKGWKKTDGKYHYFDGNDGVMAEAKVKWLNNQKHEFDLDGNAFTGWQTFKRDGSDKEKTVYYNEYGVLQTGWHIIDGKNYYLEGGKRLQDEARVLDNQKHEFGPDGAAFTGWQTFKRDGSDKEFTIYYNEYGVVQKGKQHIDGQDYDFGEDGELIS
ncbi:hypothetical protein [Bacillus sp. 196mf]|uniref:N-acetylmuramoyl-L-alanine amidase family protein n=1 Tax=Bacillus sp. 196mf TaxID=1761754 RepID=UPI000D7BC98D|nr:hypothetical protein [Bacillus sp. 196mf]PYE88567.1 glucan-binding repeat-containing protein [Bacillus sp. 196mf]